MVAVTLIAAIVFVNVVQVKLGDVPERTCGTLFSGEKLSGESFTLSDFDQSPNLKKEFRHSRDGWTYTKSIKVENGCTMTTCSDTYFLGSCQSFTSKDAAPDQLMSTIKSAHCTCERICRCEDFYITDDEFELSHVVARAYHAGGCDTCDSEYTLLYESGSPLFSHVDRTSPVEALVVRRGCSITFFTQRNFGGDALSVINSPVYRGRPSDDDTLSSYMVTCQSSERENQQSELKTYLPLGGLPVAHEALRKMLLSNKTLANHQGIQAALDSLQINRSSRRAYIFIVGRDSQEVLGFEKCTREYYASPQIRECGIPVDVDNLGISTELRVVSIQNLLSTPTFRYSVEQMEKFLSGHEELNRILPNAVIIDAYIHFEDIFNETSEIQETLKGVQEFRHRLIDDNYSNVLFHLASLHALSPIEQQTQPESRVAEFEEIIRGQLNFLNPVAFALSSGSHMGDLRHKNGYGRITNGEYWPRNLEVGLVNICKKSGDPLGESILRAYFQDTLPLLSNAPAIRVVDNTLSGDGASVGKSAQGYGVIGDSASEFIYGDIFDHADHSKPHRMDEDCGCASISTELNQEIAQLKSELEVERSERLMDSDRVKAEIWAEFKLKWKMHFEL